MLESLVQFHRKNFDYHNEMLLWLINSSPAGFKLNNELSRFYGSIYQWILALHYNLLSYLLDELCKNQLWLNNEILKFCIFYFVLEHQKFVLRVIHGFYYYALVGHLRLLHVLSKRMLQWQLRSLRSLFHLLRGKKLNVLTAKYRYLPKEDDGVIRCNKKVDQGMLASIIGTWREEYFGPEMRLDPLYHEEDSEDEDGMGAISINNTTNNQRRLYSGLLSSRRRDLDRQLLGTILFCVLLLAAPTAIAYWLLFATTMSIIVLVDWLMTRTF